MVDIERSVVKSAFWALPIEDVYNLLHTSDFGLYEEDVLRRQKIFGSNRLAEQRRFSRLEIFARQIKNPLIFVLIVAGVITLWVKEYLDSVFIFAAVFVNSILGFYQENKAEQALQHLKTYIKERVIVTRQGHQKEIDSQDLVPGDIIHFRQGDRVAADARIIYANNLSVDQAVLTGESLPAEKSIEPASFQSEIIDQSSMVFSGTLVVDGVGVGIVTGTGQDTRFGRIAALLTKTKSEKTPLQEKIYKFTVKASVLLGALTVFIFFLGLYFGRPIFEMFLTSVAIAIGAVPEGLPIALTVILAIGVERLAERNGVVRKLLAAETLGDVSVILTDKTGTLTQAKMELVNIEVNPLAKKKTHFEEHKKLALKLAIVSSPVFIENPDDSFNVWKIAGRPIERAIVIGAAKEGVLAPDIKPNVLDILPFNSKNKYSATLFKENGHKPVLAILGAPEIILGFCDKFFIDGRTEKIKKSDRESLLDFINLRAFAGERLLAVAYKQIDGKKVSLRDSKTFHNFTFTGILSIRDPLRPNVVNVVKSAEEAGIKVVIVTGDHRGTAEAVGRELGWGVNHNGLMDGPELGVISKEDLAAKLPTLKVFSRVTPEGKVKIVEAYKERGELVAMLGDGVNDAPALKSAMIGVTVGSGTDVTKQVADLVLLDDNFETLLIAIEEGRRIIENIKKVIVFMFSNVLDELIVIGGSLVFGLVLPLNALQILWVNFFTDSFPGIALAFEKGFDNFLKDPPSFARKKSLLDPEMRFLILVVGTFSSLLIFGLYYWLLSIGFSEELVRTFIFLSFGTYTLFLSFSIRSLRHNIWEYNPFSNFYVVAAAALGLILMTVGVYAPFFQNIFNTASLPFSWFMAAIGFGLFNIVVIELAKLIYKKR